MTNLIEQYKQYHKENDSYGSGGALKFNLKHGLLLTWSFQEIPSEKSATSSLWIEKIGNLI